LFCHKKIMLLAIREQQKPYPQLFTQQSPLE
jgi:hypothetical protein